MFDEYAHLITNSLDTDNNLVDNLHYTIASSMDVRTTIYTIDTFNAFKARANGTKENQLLFVLTLQLPLLKEMEKKRTQTEKRALEILSILHLDHLF